MPLRKLDLQENYFYTDYVLGMMYVDKPIVYGFERKIFPFKFKPNQLILFTLRPQVWKFFNFTFPQVFKIFSNHDLFIRMRV